MPQVRLWIDEFNARRALNLTAEEYNNMHPLKLRFWLDIIHYENKRDRKERDKLMKKLNKLGR